MPLVTKLKTNFFVGLRAHSWVDDFESLDYFDIHFRKVHNELLALPFGLNDKAEREGRDLLLDKLFHL